MADSRDEWRLRDRVLYPGRIALAALAWSQMRPRDLNIAGEFSLPNFWWQFLAILVLAGLTLICGSLQENFGWYPTEVQIEPPLETGHAHAHH